MADIVFFGPRGPFGLVEGSYWTELHRKPGNLREFKQTLGLLGPNSRLVFNDQFPKLHGRNWRRAVDLLIELRRAEAYGFNPLLVAYDTRDDQPDALAFAGKLGVTASELVAALGSLRVSIDDVLTWLLDRGWLCLRRR